MYYLLVLSRAFSESISIVNLSFCTICNIFDRPLAFGTGWRLFEDAGPDIAQPLLQLLPPTRARPGGGPAVIREGQ